MTADDVSDSRGRPRLSLREQARGRVTLQQRQKQDSRDRLIAAMREALETMPYVAIAVEDIAARAALSRATFYKHFDSKFQVGRTLHDQFRPRIFEVYKRFVAVDSPDIGYITSCIDLLLDFYDRERPLIVAFAQMMVVEPEFVPITERQTLDILEYWSGAVPSLAVMTETSALGEIARIDGHLMLSQLNDFCYGLVIQGWKINRADGLRIMARNIMRFIADQADLVRLGRTGAGAS